MWKNANDTCDRILHHQNTEILQYKIYPSTIYDQSRFLTELPSLIGYGYSFGHRRKQVPHSVKSEAAIQHTRIQIMVSLKWK